MLSILNKRSSGHPNHCEDSYFVHEDDYKIVGAVLDGCSTGYNSHFASQFIAYSFDRICRQTNGFEYFHHPEPLWNDFVVDIFGQIAFDIRITMRSLDLTDMNFLSTIVFFVYMKEDRRLYVKFIGDGCVVVNGDYIRNDENNTPLYLAYYVDSHTNEIVNFINSRHTKTFSDVIDFSICSDGIDSFINLKNPHLDQSIPIRFLIEDSRSVKLKNGLSKKFNILTNRSEDLKLDDEHYWWDIQDDLTIIRYVASI
jgi:hypothetical protein